MPKVKKRTEVTGSQLRKHPAKAKATSVKKSVTVKRGVKPKVRTKGVKKSRKAAAATRGRPATTRGKVATPRAGQKARPTGRPTPEVEVAIKELDPLIKCGQDTSVQFLYRIDEKVDGRTTHHLVFFDHHGWYCEHGRECPAVIRAKKYNGQFARAS